jgi:hypothetical protein
LKTPLRFVSGNKKQRAAQQLGFNQSRNIRICLNWPYRKNSFLTVDVNNAGVEERNDTLKLN